MDAVFIEATNDNQNWGKFMVAAFTFAEWQVQSSVRGRMIADRGWEPCHRLVLDLQTGEGAIFRPGGLARADLMKHRIWVCPLFEPFLEWLYEQDLTNLDALPRYINLPHAEFALWGHRRPGPDAGT
jgi:hypothetical protein